MGFRRHLLLLVLVASSLGCARSYVLFPDEGDGGQVTADGAVYPGTPWGRYAETLDVLPCPTDRVLWVDTTDGAVDGGMDLDDPAMAGATLSLPEALLIAQNRSGPDTIRFDAGVFPVEAPATIDMGMSAVGVFLTETCIDGRGRGVVLDWPEEAGGSPWSFNLGPGSLLVGVTLLHLPYEISIGDAQVAGCRVQTDGLGTVTYDSGRPWGLEAGGGGIVGPGNVISAHNMGLRVYTGALVRDNYVGFDPLTGANLELLAGIDVRGDAEIRGNVFLTKGTAIWPWPIGSGPGPELTIAGNYFGVDRDRRALPRSADPDAHAFRGLELVNSHGVIGPGNVMHGTAAGITLGVNTQFWISESSITGNDAGIVHLITPPAMPPVITQVGPSMVRGGCAELGWVELFVDSGDQGERYVGRTLCEPATGFALTTFDEPLPSGMFVTATLTDASPGTSAFSAPHRIP